MHGYDSVVGPVKGVYSKDNAMNKAREHALLISDRPSYVTILTLGKAKKSIIIVLSINILPILFIYLKKLNIYFLLINK